MVELRSAKLNGPPTHDTELRLAIEIRYGEFELWYNEYRNKLTPVRMMTSHIFLMGLTVVGWLVVDGFVTPLDLPFITSIILPALILSYGMFYFHYFVFQTMAPTPLYTILQYFVGSKGMLSTSSEYSTQDPADYLPVLDSTFDLFKTVETPIMRTQARLVRLDAIVTVSLSYIVLCDTLYNIIKHARMEFLI